MRTVTDRSLATLTAGELMSPQVVRLPEEMALNDAARLLLRNQIGGAPVVDDDGKCVGVFSTTDFLRQSEKREEPSESSTVPLPVTCSFLVKHKLADGEEVVGCTLPLGVCPIQVVQDGPNGTIMIVCSQPHSVPTDWQVVDLETLPTDKVSCFMTPDPVTVQAETSLPVLARMMIDAHIHRIIVVDTEGTPIGVVSSTDLLAALAYSHIET
jgi:CBS domain-containing protein